MIKRRQRCEDTGQGGQSLVEFALVMPIFMLLLMGLLEYGFLYNNILTVQYASRQGVSVAAEAGALDGADCYVLKAVEAALQSPTNRTSVQAVDVYESDTNGDVIPGRVNHYVRFGSLDCPGANQPYTLEGEEGYPQTLRGDSLSGGLDLIGVHIDYTYYGITPIAVTRRRRPATGTGERGQAMVEFTLVLPVFLLILLGTLEYGAAMDHRTAMAYAVREGARVGASLGKGGSNPTGVDPAIVAAVQRGLTDPILIEDITSIEIFKADPSTGPNTGKPMPGKINKYDRAGNLVGTAGWPATTRVQGLGLNGDSIGVTVRYDFHPVTPLASVIGLIFGGNPPYTTLPMSDTAVIHLEPAP
jgi:Flp pilus assembly protein TadG